MTKSQAYGQQLAILRNDPAMQAEIRDEMKRLLSPVEREEAEKLASEQIAIWTKKGG